VVIELDFLMKKWCQNNVISKTWQETTALFWRNSDTCLAIGRFNQDQGPEGAHTTDNFHAACGFCWKWFNWAKEYMRVTLSYDLPDSLENNTVKDMYTCNEPSILNLLQPSIVLSRLSKIWYRGKYKLMVGNSDVYSITKEVFKSIGLEKAGYKTRTYLGYR
jgi:hypothetical protein